MSYLYYRYMPLWFIDLVKFLQRRGKKEVYEPQSPMDIEVWDSYITMPRGVNNGFGGWRYPK